MDSLCERLETLTSQLSRSLEAMHRPPGAGPIAGQSEDLMMAAQVLNSLPNVQKSVVGIQTSTHVHNSRTTSDGNMHPDRAVALLRAPQTLVNDELQDSLGSEDYDTNDDEHQDETAEGRKDEHVGQAGALVRDSYGRPR